MATPEERKASLFANRFTRPSSSPSTPGVPNAPTPQRSDAQSQPHERRSALQSSRLRALALATSLAFTPSSNPASEQDETSQDRASEQELYDEQERRIQMQTAINEQTRQQQAQSEQMEQARAQQDSSTKDAQTRRFAKAAFKRGLIYVLNFVAAPFFIVSMFLYVFTFGWLNLELFYGKYFAKGKSRYVDPLSWDPIPMPIDKDGIILTVFIITADIALVIGAVVIGFGGFCLFQDVAKVTSSVSAALEVGAAVAQGQSAGLCFGGIIGSVFGP